MWIQPHFDPHVYSALGSPEQVLDAVLETAATTGAPLGVGFGLTMTLRRGHPAARSEELAAFAIRHPQYRALGLVGDEALHPSAPFARAFAQARDAGLSAAPHAGELAGPQSVRTAVDTLGATRIAHGVRAAEDPGLLTELAERRISLDVCPTSNTALGVVPSTADHPLPHLLAAGIPCTLGTDDPLMFGASLLDEYETARSVLGLTDAQLAALAETSIRTSGAPSAVVDAAVLGIAEWLAG